MKEEEKEMPSAEGMLTRVKRFIMGFQTPRTIVQFLSFFLFNALFLGLGPLPILLDGMNFWSYF